MSRTITSEEKCTKCGGHRIFFNLSQGGHGKELVALPHCRHKWVNKK